MSDIVELLREGEAEGVDGWWFVMAEAANEIERLRAAYEAMDKMLREANQHFMRVDMERNKLRAENETLRRDVKTAVMGDSAELADVKRDNETLRREAVIRIDQITREQEAHLRTISDYNRAMVKNDKLHKALKPFAYYASQIPDDVSDTCSASGTVGDLRAAAAAIRESGG